MDVSVTIAGKTLPNPVGVASGTFGYASEFEGLTDLNTIGAIYTKAVTALPRAGNDPPRLVETPSGMLNAIGLANVGVEQFIEKKVPFLQKLKSPVIVNVAGTSEEDYLAVLDKLENVDCVWGYEINLSCPNVKHGCMSVGTDAELVESFTRQLKAATSKPVIVKLTPNVTDIASIAMAAEQGGADAVSLINTLIGMVIDIKKKKPVLSNITGGLSGPAIFPVGLACTYKVSRAVSIPVIGMGGISSANEAIQYLLAGASAVQIGTANFINGDAANETLKGIEEYMASERLSSISDFHSLLT